MIRAFPLVLYEKNFNSTTVRLGACDSWIFSINYPKFQFHHGTIVRSGTTVLTNPKSYFNSTTVRLGELIPYASFNSLIYFNSTTVRLGDLPMKWPPRSCSIFQFHHGTIGRITLKRAAPEFPISIPPRYDWELHLIAVSTLNFVFQFHHGTIGSRQKSSIYFPKIRVS